MKQYTHFVAQIFLLLLCSFASFAKDLPYKGRATGHVLESQFLAEPAPGAGVFLWECAEASGNFTKLGRAKIYLEWNVSLELEGEKLVFVLVGTFEIKASDGSAMGGTFCSLQDFDSTENQIEVEVQHGTGRFAGVSGIIPGSGTRNGSDFSYNLEGLIFCPSGKKSK